MLLHDALLQAECPICLQQLGYVVPPPPSRPESPQHDAYGGFLTTASPFTSGSYVSSITHSPISLPNRSSSNVEADSEFRITFAPGVYGSDAADPWDPSFALATSNSAGPPSHTSGASASTTPPHADNNGGPADNAGKTGESACGVAVLPCGHLLHYLCATQLCEYAPHPFCPVCRKKLCSAADLVLFSPRARAPARTAATAATVSTPIVPQVGSSLEGEGVREGVSSGKRKRGRREEQIGPQHPSDHPSAYSLDGEERSNVTIISDEAVAHTTMEPSKDGVLGGTKLTGSNADEVRVDSASTSTALIEPLSSSTGTAGTHTSRPTSPRSSAAARTQTRDKHNVGEDDILIIGARQLPPVQAYAELLLRTTATWADRTDVLKARVTHLERSQQQLQSDCAELDRTLTAARRRRELLLNLPSASPTRGTSGGGAEALPAFERLRELRRLCGETRTAMTEATVQLAASTREHAEVRRQIEKYTRKLLRLNASEVETEQRSVDGKERRRSDHPKLPRSSGDTGVGGDGRSGTHHQ
jgi:phage shock protein A